MKAMTGEQQAAREATAAGRHWISGDELAGVIPTDLRRDVDP